MPEYISGIQQIGIGVKNARECLLRYKDLFGMDTLVFDDESEARLMSRYTGGQVFRRKALLSLNLQGGGGFEIWQFRDRMPKEPDFFPKYGDLGIYAAKIKCADVSKTHNEFRRQVDVQLPEILTEKNGTVYFWLRDPFNNVFKIVSGNHWFRQNKKMVGGVTGAVIGVSNMQRSLAFYQRILSIDQPILDETVNMEAGPEGGTGKFRRVILQKHPCGKGAFSKLLGSIDIELVECRDREPALILSNRFWGDCGFIHLCFDVFDMCGLKQCAEAHDYKFTVDSIDSFDMENASGRFCYIEDPDGTLIGLVETHKIPIYKKMGIFLNLKKRNLEKPLPDWMIRLLSLSKVK